MEFEELRRLAEQGEHLHLEFKIKLPEASKLMREAIALANTEGGYLLIGVDDDGTIMGVKDPDEVEQFFELKAKEHCRPPIEYRIVRIPITRKRTVVAIKIPKSKHKKGPHARYESHKEKRGTAFYRVRDKSITASTELFFILKNQKTGRNIKFEFGEKEKVLFQYLLLNPSITLTKFKEIARLKKFIASRTLVTLVSANVLKIIPDDSGDIFVLPERDGELVYPDLSV